MVIYPRTEEIAYLEEVRIYSQDCVFISIQTAGWLKRRDVVSSVNFSQKHEHLFKNRYSNVFLPELIWFHSFG